MRLFFHIEDGGAIIEDMEGREFDNLDAARTAAISVIRTMLAEALSANTGIEINRGKLTIADESGVTLDEISFAEAIRSVDKFFGSKPAPNSTGR